MAKFVGIVMKNHWYKIELQKLSERLMNEQVPIGDTRIPEMAAGALADELGKLVALMCATFNRREDTAEMMHNMADRASDACTLFEIECDEVENSHGYGASVH